MRRHVRRTHARDYEFRHVSLFNELFNVIVLYLEVGSIAETSVETLLTAWIL